MSATDGINSLQKMLGSLDVGKTTTSSPVRDVTGGRTKAFNSSPTAASGTGDAATLSAAGGLAVQAAGSDVRMARVVQLQQAIASGSYNIPASAVADKMIEGMLKVG